VDATRAVSAAVVTVAGNELIDSCRMRFDPSAARGMPAHITVLYPFASVEELRGDVVSALEDVCARTKPFDFELVDLGSFPGVLYLVPEPQGKFVDLVESLSRALPAWPPYSGAYAEVVPHLTIAQRRRVPRRARRQLSAGLPLACRASFLDVLVEEDAGWRTLRRFELGAGE
jgi:2'-5' RNA ligase